MNSLYLLAAAVLLNTGCHLSAQDVGSKVGSPVVQQGASEAKGGDADDPAAENASRASTVHPKLHYFLVPMVSSQPERLAADQQAEIAIVMTLQREAVLTQSADIALKFAIQQGPLSLGSWRIEPPKKSIFESFYLGQMVYDNFAIIRLPVTVARGTKDGYYPVEFEMTANVNHGKTGESRGRNHMYIHGRVKVGDPLPEAANVVVPEYSNSKGHNLNPGFDEDGNPIGSQAAVQAPAPKAVTPKALVPTFSAAPVGGGDAVAETPSSDAAGSSNVAQSSDLADTALVADDSLDLWLYGAPIGLVLLILFLALSRRRS